MELVDIGMEQVEEISRLWASILIMVEIKIGFEARKVRSDMYHDPCPQYRKQFVAAGCQDGAATDMDKGGVDRRGEESSVRVCSWCSYHQPSHQISTATDLSESHQKDNLATPGISPPGFLMAHPDYLQGFAGLCRALWACQG